MLYRTREGFTLTELAKLYQWLLHRIYPTLQTVDFVEYAKTIEQLAK